ncbi:MAG TPA: hypothetical protein PLT46_09150 [Burkholderiaceae bacterium]|nr:hypothetical protein [Burkholderiaceae bacterium]
MSAKKPPNADKTPSKPAKRRTDWDAVERDYRTGKFTLRELEAKHGANNSLISRKAKAGGWTQDLADAIRQATNARLDEETVSKEVRNGAQKVSTVVLAVAEQNTKVILGHRTGLARLNEIKNKLLNQIEQAADNLPDLEEVIEMIRKPDDNGRDAVNDAMRKAMSRSALVDDLKKLADVDEKARKGEREAFKIDAPAEKTPDEAAASRYTDAERAAKLLYLMNQAKGQQAAQ